MSNFFQKSIVIPRRIFGKEVLSQLIKSIYLLLIPLHYQYRYYKINILSLKLLLLINSDYLNIMKVVTQIPISKTHSISLCSLGCFCILILSLITILVPFFLVFTEGFFKNSSQTHEQFSITSTNQYYISATSSLTSVSLTNLDSKNTINSNLLISNIQMSEQDYDANSKNDKFIFQAIITQPETTASKITSVTVLLFFNALSSSVNTTAMTIYRFNGPSISSGVSTGYLEFVQNQIINTTSSNTNYSSNPFVDNYYNIQSTLQSYYQQATFFRKVSNEFVLNENSPECKIKIVLNLDNQQKLLVKSGIFEQIQWSWCYYFPVAFVLGYFSVMLLNVMFKYGVIESRIRRY